MSYPKQSLCLTAKRESGPVSSVSIANIQEQMVYWDISSVRPKQSRPIKDQ